MFDNSIKLARQIRNGTLDLSQKAAIISELRPHLIGEHLFFGGKKSPYRADPNLLIKALNLG